MKVKKILFGKSERKETDTRLQHRLKESDLLYRIGRRIYEDDDRQTPRIYYILYTIADGNENICKGYFYYSIGIYESRSGTEIRKL